MTTKVETETAYADIKRISTVFNHNLEILFNS